MILTAVGTVANDKKSEYVSKRTKFISHATIADENVFSRESVFYRATPKNALFT